MIATLVQTFITAYALGFIAAAPIGPVNTVAIHRGIIGKWSHTFCCGIGSAAIDILYFAGVLIGGQHLLNYLRDPRVENLATLIGMLIIVPLGVFFIRKSLRYDMRDVAAVRKRMRNRPPAHLWTDVGTGAALTIINPATLVYWAGAGTSWVSKAQPLLGDITIPWGILAGSAGLLSWFSLLSIFVKFTPEKIGPKFFRIVNGICGLLLLVFGVWLAVTFVIRYFAL